MRSAAKDSPPLGKPYRDAIGSMSLIVDARLCLAALPATYCLPGNVEALGKLLLGKPAFMAQAG